MFWLNKKRGRVKSNFARPFDFLAATAVEAEIWRFRFLIAGL